MSAKLTFDLLQVLAMSEEEFAEHAEKEGWSDADSSTSEDSSLTYGVFSVWCWEVM